MAYDLEEQEKLDAIRDWWAQYGALIVSLFVAAAIAVVGYRGWQWYQGHKASQAMGYYEALEASAQRDDDKALERLKAASKTLQDDFPRSGYTVRGALLAAQALQARDDLDGAAKQLQWILDHHDSPAFVDLAKLRLGGVLMAQEKYDDALKILESPSEPFAGLFADRRGDILLAQGQAEQAREQWETALQALEQESVSQVVRLKLDALRGG